MAMLKNQRVYKNLCLLTLTCQAATIDIDIYIYIDHFPKKAMDFHVEVIPGMDPLINDQVMA